VERIGADRAAQLRQMRNGSPPAKKINRLIPFPERDEWKSISKILLW